MTPGPAIGLATDHSYRAWQSKVFVTLLYNKFSINLKASSFFGEHNNLRHLFANNN